MMPPNSKFNLGQLVATPGALAEFTPEEQQRCLARHLQGDWGDLGAEDKRANDQALKDGSRLLSSYVLPENRKLYIITEAVGDDGQREATTLLLPEEY